MRSVKHTLALLGMYWTPVEAPDRRASVENVRSAFGKEVGCSKCAVKVVSGSTRESVHIWRVSYIDISVRVCLPYGPKWQIKEGGGCSPSSPAGAWSEGKKEDAVLRREAHVR